MAFTPIEEEEIATGEPVKRSTQEKIKTNFDNHESRITSIETGTGVTYPPIIMRINGRYDQNVEDGILKTTCNFNLTLTGVRIIIDQAGSGGTTEVDIRYKRGEGSWTSVFDTRPSIAHSAGNDAISTAGVLNMERVGLQAGDLIALDLKSAQTNGRGFMVRIDFMA